MVDRVAPQRGDGRISSRRVKVVACSLVLICLGVALLAVRNRETSKELAEGRTLGSLAMQEEAHELKVLERVGRDHPRAKKVHMDLKPHPILKTNLAEVPPKHLKIKNTRSSSESSNAGDGWKNLGAVAEPNIFDSKANNRPTQ